MDGVTYFLVALLGLVAATIVAVLVNLLGAKGHGVSRRAILSGIGVFIVVQALALTAQNLLSTFPSKNPSTSSAPPRSEVPSLSATAEPTLTPSAPMSTDGASTSSPESQSTPTEEPGPASPLWLTDIDPDDFVRKSYNAHRGNAQVNGTDHPKSYWYEFYNCSSCKSTDTFTVSGGYTRIRGAFGLTDDTRHDSVIDGVVFISIYSGDRLILGPKRVEYPNTVRFDLPLHGPRVSLVVDDGTNYENAAWLDVEFLA